MNIDQSTTSRIGLILVTIVLIVAAYLILIDNNHAYSEDRYHQNFAITNTSDIASYLNTVGSASAVSHVKGPEIITITLERSPCYGTCPYYSLKIFGNGTVSYNGYEFVKVTGHKISNISQEKVQKLIEEFYKINYFSLNDTYTKMMATDMPWVTTSINVDGTYKRIVDYHGAIAPKSLLALEDKIDQIANSKKWVTPYVLPPGKTFFDTLMNDKSK